ncbi:MAG: Soluble pyridine nucleotide transhydrogenase [Elusimicrobia bacterium]|nr:Soluble pyridine nucleotide transhydrogenase [Elusimicrobiota bacterium]
MKRVDVAIIGAGRSGVKIAEKLSAAQQEVLLLSLPENPEDSFRHFLNAVAGMPPSAPLSLPPSAVLAKSPPCFLNAKTLLLNEEEIHAKHFIIASGSWPEIPPDFHGKKFQTPLEVLTSPSPPSEITIMGAGPVGVGTAARLAHRKCQVTLITSQDRILPQEEPEISAAVQTWLLTLGVHIALEQTDLSKNTGVLAMGLRPNTRGMNLPKAGVYVNPEERIVVDAEMKTPNRHIHAVGPVTGPVFNLAFEDFQADLVSENVLTPFFNRQKLQPEPFPWLLPMDLPLARIGLTETQACAEKRGVLAINHAEGKSHIKLVGRKKTTELLGAHLFGPGMDSLIVYFDLLMRAGIGLREVNERHHMPEPGPARLAQEAIQAWLKAAGE